ncbi:virulence factor [Nisaea nitritireducens]|uniref:virulence factor n=1 Tax=Nisaea nitritireducens TaxID=568392 RepID=UPI001865ADD0|nr:virulence factor [Nisaea nitritireducens]
MAHLIIVYWRDIPAQVIAERGRGRKREQAKVELPVRFIHAIDMAAMRDGSEDEGAYLEGWRRADPVECGDDLEAEAQAAAEALEREYDGAKLKALIANGGNA